MSDLSISLAIYNGSGYVSYIENEEYDDIEILRASKSKDAPAVCRKAAQKLRTLADAFEHLASMKNPCTAKAQTEALELAARNANA